MITFTSKPAQGNLAKHFSEENRWFNVNISPSVTSNLNEEWYQIIDSRKSWKNNNKWTRIIKRDMVRINFAKKNQMTPFDREVEIFINQTYPIPTE